MTATDPTKFTFLAVTTVSGPLDEVGGCCFAFALVYAAHLAVIVWLVTRRGHGRN